MTASAPGTAAPRLLGTLLPAWAAGAELRGGAGPQPWLYEEEDEQLGEDAVPKRWQEFARARMCARRALAAVGAGAGPLLRGPHGAPRWPSGIVGSITHCRDYCAAVAAPRRDAGSLGIDAERAVPLRPALLPRITSPGERERLAALPTRPGLPWGTLMFCAKEAAYKAWYPWVEEPLGFHTARVVPEPDRDTLTVRPTESAPVGLPVLEGRYAAEAGLLVVVVHSRRSA
ncbi:MULTISPECIES: 4'-phosphopantetheinyl transferase superfamily protein [Streptomyces]|uniref:4'-phosphopantetheinyl transferase superfamily protein n=1 Tax=Streptomyces thermocarboxydus TaxID=59299 RepID=A0ABU3JC24_9ACTN|nr:4'-phosphopantetheinyl transferase superfamily protein [Streptomyces sp. McG8]MDT6972616.1 4'-phosphopantetheinyl transferase superfamily protein [Streptomyces thermocarboxydus]WSB83138.1 4'-phosphopantetheinyl transferase superfamily protein [Streptomyces cellulosae]